MAPAMFRKKVFDIVEEIQTCLIIQISSTKILIFCVNDMLTLAQLEAKKFRKNLSNFNLKKIVEEVIKIQEEKLVANNITILTEFEGF
jgi:signal transduction histidine kinase